MTDQDKIAALEKRLNAITVRSARAIATLSHIASHEPKGSCSFCKDDFAVKLVSMARDAIAKFNS